MGQVICGDLSARASRLSDDEIGDLAEQFNQMVIHISTLMNQIIAEQEAKRKSDIQFLQSQINPHFLYNTLTSLRYMVLAGRKEDAETSILALNRILRYSLSEAQQYITINMEMDMLANYLTIANFSFETPMDATIDIDPAIGSCLTIRLLLQPIVENAILHGLKATKIPPKLRIQGYADGDSIVFSIKDNGVGFDVSTLNMEEPPRDSSHIGIKNVNMRIKLQFGSAYSLKIYSRTGIGTTVIIRIPRIEEQEELMLYDDFDC